MLEFWSSLRGVLVNTLGIHLRHQKGHTSEDRTVSCSQVYSRPTLLKPKNLSFDKIHRGDRDWKLSSLSYGEWEITRAFHRLKPRLTSSNLLTVINLPAKDIARRKNYKLITLINIDAKNKNVSKSNQVIARKKVICYDHGGLILGKQGWFNI